MSKSESGENPADGHANSSDLNQWGFPIGPNGGCMDEWTIIDLSDSHTEKLKCKNRISGYRVDATECCSDTYKIELAYYDDPSDNRVSNPSEQWSEQTVIQTEDLPTALYKLCQEYSPLPFEIRRQSFSWRH